MDLPKRVLLPQGSPRRSPKAMTPRAMEGDENASPGRSVAAGPPASPQRKKVLGQRNGDGGGREVASSAVAHQPKSGVPSPPSLTGRGAGKYDPRTNCTTPRPDFLRYDPERRREILLRLEREVEDESSSASATSGSEVSEAVSSGSSAPGSYSEYDDDVGDEEKVVPAHGGGRARRLFLLLVAVACSFCYIYCMNSAPYTASPEEHLNFVGQNNSIIYDAGVHQVVSLLEPTDMMGSEDVLEAAIGQIEHGDSEGGVYLHGPGDSPRNFMAIAVMGMADVCPNVPSGELTCHIGDESSENLNDLKEDSELGEQKAEVIAGSFENAEHEVVCSVADVIGDSIGSTLSVDMEEGNQGLINQEEGEDNSDHSVPQSVSMEEIMESDSEKVANEEGLESEKLDQVSEPWEEYENTAEAAMAICAMIKRSWSVVEPHLMQMLACLSITGFVAAMLKYFQRSRKVPVPVSKHMPSAQSARVPVLAPHKIAQLPGLPSPPSVKLPSPPSVKLPMFPSQQPLQPTVHKQEPSVSLELPMQSPLLKPDPSVSLSVPSIDHGNHDQKNKQGGDGSMRVSGSNTMDHKEIDSLKPPVVQLLGEFSFADAGSRGMSIKDSNRSGGDAKVQESLLLRKDAVKIQMESGKLQSPSVQRARTKENAAEVEKMDATPTPLRRSSRLRNLTSP